MTKSSDRYLQHSGLVIADQLNDWKPIAGVILDSAPATFSLISENSNIILIIVLDDETLRAWYSVENRCLSCCLFLCLHNFSFTVRTYMDVIYVHLGMVTLI